MLTLKTQEQVNKIRQTGKIVAGLLSMLRANVNPGITTAKLDTIASHYLAQYRATTRRYIDFGVGVFPPTINISINDEVINGTPSKYILHAGDLLKLVAEINVNGWSATSAITVPVGQIDREAMRLLTVTENALYQGIEAAHGNNKMHDIGRAIQQHVEKNGFSVVREYHGYGIGRSHREEPLVFSYSDNWNDSLKLKPGITFSILAIVNAGSAAIEKGSWTVFTADKSLSATFGHTIAITEGKPDILTL